MKFGAVMFATDYSIRPDDFAKECEDRGFESVWYPEHTHIPASRRSPFPGGGELPKEYWHTHDLFASLMAAAAATKTIKVGSGICLVQEHDPIKLAKEVATVDQLSNGRLLFGIGGGWNAEEMENHGTPFNRRWKILREKIEAMKVIWAEDEAEYHGEFVNFDPIWSYPKPLQKPHPPILLGVFDSRVGRARVARRGNGWIPIAFDLARTRRSISDVRERMKAEGRDPDQLTTSILYLPSETGEDTVREALDCGADRVILRVPTEDETTVLAFMDRFQKFTGL